MIKLRLRSNHDFIITVADNSPLIENWQFEPVFSGLEDLTVDEIKELVGNTDLTGFQRRPNGKYDADESAMERIEEYQKKKEKA